VTTSSSSFASQSAIPFSIDDVSLHPRDTVDFVVDSLGLQIRDVVGLRANISTASGHPTVSVPGPIAGAGLLGLILAVVFSAGGDGARQQPNRLHHSTNKQRRLVHSRSGFSIPPQLRREATIVFARLPILGEGRAIMKIVIACARVVASSAICCAISGCASQPSSASMSYVRTDNRPIDVAQMRAVLAQCKGEGARSVEDHVYAGGLIPWVTAVGSRSSKENTITNACMARNGYLAQ
jgi:hypothetical protein